MELACRMCDEESCAGCSLHEEENYIGCSLHEKEESEKVSDRDYYKGYAEGKKRGHQAGYIEGYAKACEICRAERSSPMCIYALPDGIWCSIYDTACDGYNLDCKKAKTQEEIDPWRK